MASLRKVRKRGLRLRARWSFALGLGRPTIGSIERKHGIDISVIRPQSDGAKRTRMVKMSGRGDLHAYCDSMSDILFTVCVCAGPSSCGCFKISPCRPDFRASGKDRTGYYVRSMQMKEPDGGAIGRWLERERGTRRKRNV